MKPSNVLRRWMPACAALAAAAVSHAHLPPNFVDEPYVKGWQQAAGLVWGPDERLYVWEKGGRVWVVEDGKRHDHPLIDISEEVGDWRDLGLLGFALDPDFLENGHIYLLYAVDYHHLAHFGTPAYDPQQNEYFHDSIARLTRYTADPEKGFHEVDPGSRHVLIGETISTGLPVCHQSHSTGSLVFAADGTLLVSNGDGSSYEGVDDGTPQSGSSNTALADGIITSIEDCGAFRAQLINSLSGKILRIDPATGDGIPSNPYYDPQAPRAPRSRVWALGLRNPFRFTIRPGTGSSDVAAGNPGVLVIGDVGWNQWEEINVCTSAARNFGWPLYEGLEPQIEYPASPELNLETPNPLFGLTGCELPFYRFSDLLAQESGAPSWPNPCNPTQQIPPIPHRFVHTRPVLDWGHGPDAPARTGTLTSGIAGIATLGEPGCPVAGEPFRGSSSTGGLWYTATRFPPAYRNTYFHADFSAGWIRQIIFDAAHRPVEVRKFHDHAGAIVALAQGPDGAIYFINYDQKGEAVVRRIAYVENLPPEINASATPRYGLLPLNVQFSTQGTVDPESRPLTYHWNFGDATTSTSPNPLHTFEAVSDISSEGQIIGRITSLTPPAPQGSGNLDWEVIRDADFPPVGTTDPLRQFDTFHSGDQGDSDWIGYAYSTPRTFRRLLFQEGRHSTNGGWFDNVRVQIRVGAVWVDAPATQFTPVYAGAGAPGFSTYAVSFAPISGNAIRLFGNPGGSANYMSVAELRVFADSPAPLAPHIFHVTLTVTDELNSASTHQFTIAGNNTPPTVVITSPAPGATYDPFLSFTQPLEAIVFDAEHEPDDLHCRWDRRLIHDSHAHPEPPDDNCSSSAIVTPHGPDCSSFHWEFALTVTDADGLSTTAVALFRPECDLCPSDLNEDALVDARDLSVLLSQFDQPVITGAVADINHDGFVNAADLSVLLSDFGTQCKKPS